jgi:6-phosphofructokinase
MRAFSKLGAHLIGQLKPRRVKQPSEAVVELPPPQRDRSPFLALLGRRQSQREFASEALPPELLSFLRDHIERYFHTRAQEVDVKYIDPSYLIRSCAASATDAELCLRLGQHAVHAAMAGRTRMLVASWHGLFTHVPIALATAQGRQVDPKGPLWQSVLESTGQHMCLLGQRPGRDGAR